MCMSTKFSYAFESFILLPLGADKIQDTATSLDKVALEKACSDILMSSDSYPQSVLYSRSHEPRDH
jgi:hypothetical protein